MSTAAPSLYEAISAALLEPEDVARAFVLTSHYAPLAEPNNSILVGPRGSGKTTLLRMLQQRALEAWVGEGSTAFRNSISFTGVFVPSDLTWRSQIRYTGAEA